jgi:hypothetical protein
MSKSLPISLVLVALAAFPTLYPLPAEPPMGLASLGPSVRRSGWCTTEPCTRSVYPLSRSPPASKGAPRAHRSSLVLPVDPGFRELW